MKVEDPTSPHAARQKRTAKGYEGQGMKERLYRVKHRWSRFRDRIVKVLIRPRNPAKLHGTPNNVLAQDIETGERFVCPWRGLRRVKSDE